MGGVWNISSVNVGIEVGVADRCGRVRNISSVNVGIEVGVADRCGRGLEY